ncbi:MAG: radical SAM protein [Lachnospiraceae bacterium]|nr:radical SAM protein [Lachnospiraceae bacterium]
MENKDYCNICPRKCNIDRSLFKGYCRGGTNARVALVSIHNWEEPSISGKNGSGTVFFSGCNMRCVFCQNHDISHANKGIEISDTRLAEIFIEQQERGVHNINLVSGGHFVPNIINALKKARQAGLKIPVVYNSNGYESVDTLKKLDGLIDIYIPDLKYVSDEYAIKYSSAPGYFETALSAIKEMFRQTGKNTFDESGMMTKGVIIRHLVLPSLKNDSLNVIDAIKENFGDNVYVSIMSQYTPVFKAKEYKEINRRITTFEYEKVTEHFLDIGLTNGYMQKRSSATSDYTPSFDLSGVERKDDKNE